MPRSFLQDLDVRSSGFDELPSQDGFDWGIVKEQFYDASHYLELTPEAKLHFVSLLQCVADWVNLFKFGTVSNGRFGERARPSDHFSMEDAITLHDFLFADHYGYHDPNFVSFHDICKALVIDKHTVRAALQRIGKREALLKLPLLREADYARQREEAQKVRHDKARREASARRIAVFEQTRRSGCHVCAAPDGRHTSDEVFVHKTVCETREHHVS